MNPEVKAKFVSALRGGEYKQARGYLNTNGAMCAMGVLCDLKVKEEPEKFSWKVSQGRIPHNSLIVESQDYNMGGWACEPPPIILDWAGISSEEYCKILNMNDHRSFSFLEIAKYVETL